MGIRIGIVGKGALGLMYASIAQARPGVDSVQFVMDAARLERHRDDEYFVNGAKVDFDDVAAEDAQPVDLLLVGVKSTGLPAAVEMMENTVGPDTCIVPLLNGITSEGKVAARYGWGRTVACVSYGMDAARFGTRLEYTKEGALQIGALREESAPMVERAHELLAVAGIPHTVEADIKRRLWTKFMANVGVNQVCAVYQVRYRELLSDETAEPFRMYIAAMREVLAVAHAEGIELTEADMNEYVAVIRSLDPESMPSMAQDRVNGNPCEVEEFSGEVIRRAAKFGLYVPCNQYLYNQVQIYEGRA